MDSYSAGAEISTQYLLGEDLKRALKFTPAAVVRESTDRGHRGLTKHGEEEFFHGGSCEIESSKKKKKKKKT